MLTLSEIRDEYVNLINHMERVQEQEIESYDERDDKTFINEELAKIEDTFDNKVIAISGVIRSLEAECSAISNEIVRLDYRLTAKEKTITWLREYLLTNMQLLNKSKVESPLYKVSVRTNPHSVNIINDALIPPEYRIVKTIEQINKKELLKNMKAGEIIPGAELTQTQRIDIR